MSPIEVVAIVVGLVVVFGAGLLVGAHNAHKVAALAADAQATAAAASKDAAVAVATIKADAAKV